jgi:hypothetical protein
MTSLPVWSITSSADCPSQRYPPTYVPSKASTMTSTARTDAAVAGRQVIEFEQKQGSRNDPHCTRAITSVAQQVAGGKTLLGTTQN